MTEDFVSTINKTNTAFDAQANFIPLDQRPPSAPIIAQKTHYRSKVYTLRNGANPLISSASPLFSIANMLRRTTHYENLDTLYHHLIHEMHAFESQAQRLNYRPETILVTRYMLATFLDEIILNKPWGEENWKNHKLLMYFQQEDWGGDRFFVILDRLYEEPIPHIDLLELIYMILSLGYEGKFRYQDRGHVQLTIITENLFKKIQQYRLELRPNLHAERLLLPMSTKVKYNL